MDKISYYKQMIPVLQERISILENKLNMLNEVSTLGVLADPDLYYSGPSRRTGSSSTSSSGSGGGRTSSGSGSYGDSGIGADESSDTSTSSGGDNQGEGSGGNQGSGGGQRYWPWDSAHGGNGILGDYNQDGNVDGADLGLMLGNWKNVDPNLPIVDPNTPPTEWTDTQGRKQIGWDSGGGLLGSVLGSWGNYNQNTDTSSGGGGVGGDQSSAGEQTYIKPSDSYYNDRGAISYYPKRMTPSQRRKK